jgi:hypothetical protein
MDKDSVSLSEAAREIGENTSYEVLRRAVSRLGAGRKDEHGRITISSALVKAFKTERKRSGYLHPRGAKLADLIGRNEQIADADKTTSRPRPAAGQGAS